MAIQQVDERLPLRAHAPSVMLRMSKEITLSEATRHRFLV
jgi:hypothetical protein